MIPADEIDEIRIVASWVAEHEPPTLALEPPPDADELLAFTSSATAHSGLTSAGAAGELHARWHRNVADSATYLLPPASRTARSAASKPICEWVLSQKGFVVEAPQRHSTTPSPSGSSNSLPSASMIVTGPVTL